MIGLLGGTFNPPHNGHVALARAAEEELGLADLVVLVAERPGHKEVDLDAPTRLRLARAAFPGRRVSWTSTSAPSTCSATAASTTRSS